MKRWLSFVTFLSALVSAGTALAEPCLSPYVKRLAGAEKCAHDMLLN